ncbi:MAG: LysR family transcriptional regulator [Gemmobacter sp.]|jgi:LysR family nitrogen assimilation transcriptional regulator
MHVTLRQLRYFVEAADAGSMTAAAQALNVAPTALSLQIKALEEHFGRAVFVRRSNGISLTDDGHTLIGYARRILDLVAETEGVFAVAPGRLRLGLPPAIARLIGIEAMIEGSARMPGLQLEITEGWSTGLARQLVAGELDVALVYGSAGRVAAHSVALATETFFLATAPRLAPEGAGGYGPGGIATRGVTLAAALASPVVFYGSQSMAWALTERAAQSRGARMPTEAHLDSIDLWRSLIIRGLNSSITPYGAVCDEVRRGDIVLHDIVDAPLRCDVTMLVRPGSGHERLERALAALFRDLLAESPGTRVLETRRAAS